MKFATFFVLTCFMSFTTLAHADVQLSDLGISQSETVATPEAVQMQQELQVRHKMLKTHEKLGLATAGLMTATFLTGNQGEKNDLHMYLGITSGLMYFTTAYFSLTAPKPAGIKDRGVTKWHKALAWIHFPAMVLAPVLGYIYKQNEKNGRDNPALVKQHPTIATIGYGAFMLSAALMTFEF